MFTFSEMNFRRNSFAGAGEPLGRQPDGGEDLRDHRRNENEKNEKHFRTSDLHQGPEREHKIV